MSYRIMTRTALKMIVLGIFSICLVSVSSVRIDPTDDFSFTMGVLPASEHHTDLSEGQIEAILAEKVDRLPKSQAQRLARHLIALCKKHQFDPAVVLAFVHVESRFRVRAVSPVGALGLMQLMPDTAEYIAPKLGVHYAGAKALFDPYTNLSLGIGYLAMLRERYRGASPFFHIAAYNVGPGKMDELRRRMHFKAFNTRHYYENVRRGITAIRSTASVYAKAGI